MRNIDFSIVGSAKSGTTALTMMLDQHPDIYMSSIKETNFFVRGFENTRDYLHHNGELSLAKYEEPDIIDSWEKYAAQFTEAKKSQVLGEASPWYLLNDQVPTRLLEHNPAIKIVAILRNPADVAYANFFHQIREKDESLTLEDMDSFLDETRYRDENLLPFCKHLDIPKYAQHLPAYQKAINNENLHIMIYEEFREDRESAVADLFKFLGVRSDVNVTVDQKVNVSGVTRSDTLQRFIQGENFIKRCLRIFTTRKSRARARSKIEAMNTGAKPVLDPAYRARLDAIYRNDIEYVEALLGRPITAWRERVSNH